MWATITKLILEALKLAPRYFIAVGVFFTAFLKFAPKRFLQYIDVYDFAQYYSQWLGLAFIIFVAFPCFYCTVYIISSIRNRINVKKAKKRTLQYLQTLTEEEKQILRFYIFKQTKTNALSIIDGVVLGLVAAGIICRATNLGDLSGCLAYNIADFVWDYLNKNKGLLDGTTNILRTDNPSFFE